MDAWSGPLTGNEDCSDLERLEIRLLLSGIYEYYGYDFKDYICSTISRRVHHRMEVERLSSITMLLDRVLRDEAVMKRLLADFSITMTEMFRDAGYFRLLRETVFPKLQHLPMIRIWSAGCSTGEEAYSLAILLHEANLLQKTRIYATDINDEALAQARTGTYSLRLLDDYQGNYGNSGGAADFRQYFAARGEEGQFHPWLKQRITFAAHNLVTDSSFNEFHLILCRNVLIYFNKELKNRVHQLFFDSLSPTGILGLGNREGLEFTSHARHYRKLHLDHNVYQRTETE